MGIKIGKNKHNGYRFLLHSPFWFCFITQAANAVDLPVEIFLCMIFFIVSVCTLKEKNQLELKYGMWFLKIYIYPNLL